MFKFFKKKKVEVIDSPCDRFIKHSDDFIRIGNETIELVNKALKQLDEMKQTTKEVELNYSEMKKLVGELNGQ